VRLCRSPRQRAAHFAVRRAVFVDEQEMFAGDDRDERDVRITTLHAIGIAGGRVAGAVRLYPLGEGEWKGDRLAVLLEARHGALGARLVRFAVDTAGARGGERMVAMIQLPNVAFFESLGWQRDGDAAAFHGRPHQPMAIALSPHA
jgi:putative N-acetyltransferase (TIGR04045 family)